MVQVKADFSRAADYPLVKTKLDVYNCTYVSYEHWMRDLALTRELNIDGLRYDPGWGWGEKGEFNRPYEFGGEQIGGAPEKPEYRFATLDAATAELEAHDLKTMYVCAYTPRMLQDERQSWQGKPKDLAAFAAVCRDFAEHWRKTRRASYYEVWNEPDLTDVFFHDTLEDYLEIYEYVSKALKAGDPDALVGGPALAYKDEWMPAFLNFVKERGLPLDYVSYHHYGDVRAKVEKMRSYLASDPAFATVQTLMTEFHSIQNGKPDFSMGGRIETFEGAHLMLRDLKWFLEQPDLNKVHWAQYSDPEVYFDRYGDRCGLITTDGHRKALFNAFKIYGEMPVNRNALASTDAAVDGMASSHAHKAAVVLWNESGEDKDAEVMLEGLPFENGLFKAYRIDRHHASYLDRSDSECLEAVERSSVSTSGSFRWEGTIPAYAVVYLTIEDGSLQAPGTEAGTGREIQTLYYYADRSKSNYAEFDRRSWTAYLGMANHDEACSVVGVIAEGLKPTLRIACEWDGPEAAPAGEDSLLGLRVDYEVAGEYASSVLLCDERFGSADGGFAAWGTRRGPDRVVRTNWNSEPLSLERYAPAGWNGGRCILTFLMRNTGASTRATFRLNPAIATDKASFSLSEEHASTPLAGDFSLTFLLRCEGRGRSGGWDAGDAILRAGQAYGVSLSANRLAFGVGSRTLHSSTSVTDGKRRRIAVTRDGRSGVLSLYVDGRLEATGNGPTGPLTVANGWIGGEGAFESGHVRGSISEAVVHNYVLHPIHIQELSGRRYELGVFSFGERGGQSLLDDSPYGWNGAIHGGVARATGEKGPLLRFDGIDGYATIPRKVTDDFTILFWVRTTDSGREGQWYEGKGIVDGKVEGAVHDFGISLVGSRLAFGAGDPATTVVSSVPINDGQWHHCAVARRRSDGRITLYVDGKPAGSGVGARTSLFSSFELSLGRIHTGGNYWSGELSGLRLHGQAFSDADIRDIYESEAANNEEGSR